MRYLGACVVALATTACWAVTEKDHVRKLHPLPDLTDSELRSALRRIDHDTVTLMESLHVPGLSMTIVKDGKVVWLKGYGYRNLEKKLPMTPDTITMIASCSKAFNSTLALMAVQDGKLSLDDPVRKYLPYFKLKDPVADAGLVGVTPESWMEDDAPMRPDTSAAATGRHVFTRDALGPRLTFIPNPPADGE